MSLDLAFLNTTVLAILSQPDPESEFVADFNAKALYAKSDWQGLVWKYFYKAFDFGFRTSKSLEQSKLERSFKTAEKLFKETISETRELSKKLTECYSKGKVSDEELDALRDRVVSIGNTLSSFFVLRSPFSFTSRIHRVQHVFEKVLKRPLFNAADTADLLRFEKEYAMAACESILRAPMPHQAFIDLLESKDGTLSTIQQTRLQEWIASVKATSLRLTPWLVHLAIGGIVECALKNKVDPKELPHKVRSLEVALLKQGCQLLNANDDSYTEWLNAQSTGTVVDEKAGICLGANKAHRTFEAQGLVVFERHNFPDQLVVFGKTVGLLGMWLASHVENDAMVPSVKVLAQDAEGRYLVIEKVECSLDSIPYRRTKGKVAEADEEKCNEIARLIAWMSSQKVTPREGFLPKFIFFTSQNRLRSLVPLKTEAEFDYNQLERFVRSAANKNHLALRYIMTKSQLISHPVALFYLKIAKDHLVGKPEQQIRAVAFRDAISDPQVIGRAEKMVEELKELRQKLNLALIPKLVNKEKQAREQLLQEISKALVEFQSDCGISASEWPGAEEILIDYLKSERKELFLPTK